jgi:hypothetical protein
VWQAVAFAEAGMPEPVEDIEKFVYSNKMINGKHNGN